MQVLHIMSYIKCLEYSFWSPQNRLKLWLETLKQEHCLLPSLFLCKSKLHQEISSHSLHLFFFHYSTFFLQTFAFMNNKTKFVAGYIWYTFIGTNDAAPDCEPIACEQIEVETILVSIFALYSGKISSFYKRNKIYLSVKFHNHNL